MTDATKKYVFAEPGDAGKAAARAKFGDDVVVLDRTGPGALDTCSLKIKVEANGIDHAVKMMERLADASERVTASLEKLNGQPHGGIVFQSVGEVTEMTVRPA